MKPPGTRLVYSTERGRVSLPAGRRAPAPGKDAPRTARAPTDGVVRMFRDRSGRGGKVVTMILGLPEGGRALETRAAELKRLCGAGGTVKDGALEIQGDHRERLSRHLRSLGFAVKLAGG